MKQSGNINSGLEKSSSRSIFNDVSNLDDDRSRSAKRKTNLRPALRQADRTLRKREITPSRNLNFVSGQIIGDGDRYMSMMNDEQLGIAQHLIQGGDEEDNLNASSSAPCSPQKKENRDIKMRIMRARSTGDLSSAPNDLRIVTYKRGLCPKPPVGHRSKPAVLYTCVQPASTTKRSLRYLPRSPVRVLDAPTIADDFYLNIMEWSRTNVVAVALDNIVYLWHAETGEVDNMAEFDGLSVTSVKWSTEGRYLSVGLEDGSVKLYDAGAKKCLRTINAQMQRVGCISWRKSVISYGCPSGRIYHHDVRKAQSLIRYEHSNYIETVFSDFDTHTGEVCGVKWSPDDNYFVSGGADRSVNVWDDRQLSAEEPAPLHQFTDHTATVKAIEFIPFLGMNSNMVATGGGMNDGTVKIWNLSSGQMHRSIETGNQISSILFNKSYKEMCTSHCHPRSFMRFHGYKGGKFETVGELECHTGRILCLTQSPCGEYVLSAGSDETLRLWNCWKKDKSLASLSSSMRQLKLQGASSTNAPSIR